MKNAEEQLELLGPGMTIHQHLELAAKIESPLRVKYTIRPRDRLHLDNAVPLLKLRQFQQEGHQPVIVIDNFGDDSSLDLSPIRKVVDRAEICHNADWFSKLSFSDAMTMTKNMTVAQVLSRQNFYNRIKLAQSIHLHECLKPLMHALDSATVKADVEIGTTLNLFRLNLVRETHRQVVITVPDLPEGSRVSLCDPAETMYSKVMLLPEKHLEEWWNLLPVDDTSWLNVNSLSLVEKRHKLAERLVGFFHSQEEVADARENQTSEVVIHESELENERMGICNLLVRVGLATSNQVAKRLIHPNSTVYVGNDHVRDHRLHVHITDGLVIRIRKRAVKVKLYFDGQFVSPGIALNGPLFPPIKL